VSVTSGAPTITAGLVPRSIGTSTAFVARAGVTGSTSDASISLLSGAFAGPAPPVPVSARVPDPWAVMGVPAATG
jgi:hypothetical protein